jgi:hypothetical protein
MQNVFPKGGRCWQLVVNSSLTVLLFAFCFFLQLILIFLESISPTFYWRNCANILAQIKSLTFTASTKMLRAKLLYKKGAHKMLVKLTPLLQCWQTKCIFVDVLNKYPPRDWLWNKIVPVHLFYSLS